jgi:hypothetical protein
MTAVVLRRGRLLVVGLALGQALAGTPLAAQEPTPEAHFGFRMGTDRRLAGGDALEKYFELVAARTDRARVVDIGPTTDGHRTIAAIVSAPDNVQNLTAIREVNQRLADPRTLPPEEARRLTASHKVVVAIGAKLSAGTLAEFTLVLPFAKVVWDLARGVPKSLPRFSIQGDSAGVRSA